MKPQIPTRITVPALRGRKESGPSIAAITAYDYTFASLFDEAGIDLILVGDSLGTVLQGHTTTIPVTLDQMVYHAQCVSRGVRRALVVGDLPFMTYQVSPEQAVVSAGRMIQEGGAGAVKIEGGVPMEETIRRIVSIDIPVVGHIGLTPQSYHRMGGHRIQGKTHDPQGSRAGSAERLLDDARAVERAGAFAIVLEGIPADLARQVTEELSIPTIGIGAGPHCTGQILVMHDLLGLTRGNVPGFARRFAELGAAASAAVDEYVQAVREGSFPESDSLSRKRGT